MLKGNRKYYIVLAAVFIGIVALQYLQPKPINWNRTYMAKDKIPFGSYAIFNLLKNTYATEVKTNKLPVYNFETDRDRDQSLIMINDRVVLSKLDMRRLLEFIAQGNKALICANTFGGALADSLHLETTYNWFDGLSDFDSILKKPAYEIRFVQPANNSSKPIVYSEAAIEAHFTRFDTTQLKVCAVNKQSAAMLLSASIGQGKLFLCTTPDAFTNLYVVNHESRHYPYVLLSMIKNPTIYWDEYYKTYNIKSDSPFKFIFGNDALYMAWSLLLISILIFMIFELKRRQRAIQVVKPLDNSTLQFVDVISHVYFNAGNHLHIAEEKIAYFYFEVRQKFQVDTNTINDALFDRVSRLSGIEVTAVRTLFTYCERLKQTASLTEYDLLELNDRINNFKQKSIR